MNELDAVMRLTAQLGRSPGQLNRPFESDAEFVRIGESILGITVDEHNPEEDRFPASDPEALGWNLVICTVSDLLAAGVLPAFYLHSMTLPRYQNSEYYERLFCGISAAISASKCALLGGDTSFADVWRYVGVAFGTTKRPILRTGVQPGDRLFATGPFGRGNRLALNSLSIENRQAGGAVTALEAFEAHSVRFPCRRAEAERAWPWVNAGVDTSDGLVFALRDLARVNPTFGFKIELKQELYESESVASFSRLQLPQELLLFGALGEYELLFSVSEENTSPFLSALGGAGNIPVFVGEVTADEGLWLSAGKRCVSVAWSSLPEPRELNPNDYLRELTTRVGTLVQEIDEVSR